MLWVLILAGLLFASSCNMAGRGRGRGARAARGSAADVTDAPAPDRLATAVDAREGGNVGNDPPALGKGGESEVHHCGMCGHNVGDDAIGCDRCSNWVHPSEMCSGLPNDVIKAISTLSGDAILFVCTNCRAKPSSSSGVSTRRGSASAATEANCPDQLIQQLFLSVKGICSAVMELTARMDRAFSEHHTQAHQAIRSQPQTTSQHHNPEPGIPSTPCPSNPTGDYRSVIRQEMREMQERDKRRQSIIIKGMHAESARDLIQKFGDLSLNFTGTRVELSGVVPIVNHSDLFRAKITDDDHRRLVLDRAKTLRDTEHATVFIRRDLTFLQRKELRERRAQRNGGDLGGDQTSDTQHSTTAPTN